MRIFKAVVVTALLPFLFSCASPKLASERLDPILKNTEELNKACKGGLDGACALLGRKSEPFGALSILQGPTSATQTRLMVLVPKRSRYSYYVRTEDGVLRLNPERLELPGLDHGMDRIDVTGLKPEAAYQFIVLSESGQALDAREFKSLNPAKASPKVAVASCSHEGLIKEQRQIWREVVHARPDAILLLGDNVYADSGPEPVSAQKLLRRYFESREALELYRSRTLVPVFATWDDHDYGMNDGDRTFIYKREALETFLKFYPQEKPVPGFARGPGVASWVDLFGVSFALLDDRSFRSPNGLAGPDETHFGEDQEAWLLENLKAAKRPVFLASGDQFFGRYKLCESYETNHPASLKAQAVKWKTSKVPLVFLSGDRHASMIGEIPRSVLGYKSYELTSSGIHARVYKDSLERCPLENLVVGQSGELNYMLISIHKASDKVLDLSVESKGLGAKSHFQRNIKVKR